MLRYLQVIVEAAESAGELGGDFLEPEAGGVKLIAPPVAMRESSGMPPAGYRNSSEIYEYAAAYARRVGLDAGRGMAAAEDSTLALAGDAPLRLWNAGGGGPLRLALRTVDGRVHAQHVKDGTGAWLLFDHALPGSQTMTIHHDKHHQAYVDKANAALNRIEIPQDAVGRIAELLTSGSSLIISDYGISDETGKDTDFIVLTH